MSQQRPDRIKQMLHYLWQHRHLSTQQAMELLAMRKRLSVVISSILSTSIGHDPRSRLHGLRRQYRRQRVRLRRETYIAICGEKRNSCPCPNNDQRWRLLFSTPAQPASNWRNAADARVKVICNDIKIANELGCFPHVESYIIGGLIRGLFFGRRESGAGDDQCLFRRTCVYLLRCAVAGDGDHQYHHV